MKLKGFSLINVNLRWFMLAMILANIAGQMIYSMLSLYLIDLGASVGQVGLVFTIASLIPIILQIFGGWLSDTVDACEPLPSAARSLFLVTWFSSFHHPGNG